MLYSILVLFIATINWLSAAHPDDLDAPSTRRSVSGAATSIPTLTTQDVIDALTTGMIEFHRARVVGFLGDVPADRRQEFFNAYKALITPDMNKDYRVNVILSVGAVPADRWQQFTDGCKGLTGNVDEYTRFISELAQIPVDKYKEFTDACNLLITNFPDTNRSYGPDIISAVAKVPSDKQLYISTATINIVTRWKMRGFSIAKIIKYISDLGLTQEEIIARPEAINTRITDFLDTHRITRFYVEDELIMLLMNNPKAIIPDRFIPTANPYESLAQSKKAMDLTQGLMKARLFRRY